MHNLHPVQINLNHLESRSKFAPGPNLHPKPTPRVQIVHINTALDTCAEVRNRNRAEDPERQHSPPT